MCEVDHWFAAGLGVVVGLMLLVIIMGPLLVTPKRKLRKVKRHV